VSELLLLTAMKPSPTGGLSVGRGDGAIVPLAEVANIVLVTDPT
jgi:hypothetical protein